VCAPRAKRMHRDTSPSDNDSSGTGASFSKKRQACRARINVRCTRPKQSPRVDISGPYDLETEITHMLDANSTAAATSATREWQSPPSLPHHMSCLFKPMPDSEMCSECAAFVKDTLHSVQTQANAIIMANISVVATCLREIECDGAAFARGQFTPKLIRVQMPLYIDPVLLGSLTLAFPNVRIDVDHDSMSKIAAMIAMLHYNETNVAEPGSRCRPPESAVNSALSVVDNTSRLATSLKALLHSPAKRCKETAGASRKNDIASSVADRIVESVTSTILSASECALQSAQRSRRIHCPATTGQQCADVLDVVDTAIVSQREALPVATGMSTVSSAPSAPTDEERMARYKSLVSRCATTDAIVPPIDMISAFGTNARLSNAEFYTLFIDRFKPCETLVRNAGSCLVFRSRRVQSTQPENVAFVSAQAALMFFTDTTSAVPKVRYCEPGRTVGEGGDVSEVLGTDCGENSAAFVDAFKAYALKITTAQPTHTFEAQDELNTLIGGDS